MNDRPEQPAVAIDLGTTFSVVAALSRDGRPETVVNEEGDLSTPSIVYFDDGGPVVGNEAINAAEFEPQRIAQFAKRDMGGQWYAGEIEGQRLPPEVIQALILKKLKNDAALRIGHFDQAVITVPAYFNEPRRKATQDAGQLAGIRVLDIINEPTAAAIAYGASQGFLDSAGNAPDPETVLVYDLGGGTFDVSLMEIRQNNFRTLATAGDAHLGGIDWDQRLMQLLAEQFRKQTGIDPSGDAAGEEKLRSLATRAKKTMSARPESSLRMHHGGQQAQLRVTRDEFEASTADLVERTRLTLQHLLKRACIGWGDVTRLLLVGGSTRMPMIGKMLERESGKSVDRSLSPDEAVAHGAAVYAGILQQPDGFSGSGVSVSNVNSHDLGVLGINPQTRQPRRQVMIPRNSSIPMQACRKFVTSKDSQKEVVVTVVEGGADNGAGATRIGKCVIKQLPADLPRGTAVNVTFEYLADGRLQVAGSIEATDCQTTSTIERATGMSAEQMVYWKTRLDAGTLLEAGGRPIADRSTGSDHGKEQAAAVSANASLPANALSPANASLPAPNMPDSCVDGREPSGSIQIESSSIQSREFSLSGIDEFLTEHQSRQLASDTNVGLIDPGDGLGTSPPAGASAVDALNQANEQSTPDVDQQALDDFLKNLDK